MTIFETEPARKDGDRSVTLTWDLGPGTTRDDEPCTALAQLLVLHQGDRKRFLAVAQRTDLVDYHGRQIETFAIGSGTRVQFVPVPVARYSAKALEAAVVTALAELRSRIADDDVIALGDANSAA